MPDLQAQLEKHIQAFVADVTSLARQAAMEALGQAIGVQTSAQGRRGAQQLTSRERTLSTTSRRTRAALARSPATEPVEDTAAPTAGPVAASETRAAPTNGERRSPADLARTRAAIVEYLAANPGKRAAEIAEALRMRGGDLVLPLRKLVESGQVWAEGKTRWTRYVVVDAAKQHALEAAGPADATETALG